MSSSELWGLHSYRRGRSHNRARCCGDSGRRWRNSRRTGSHCYPSLKLVDGGGLDAAVLDYRLEREVSSPIADWLGRISVPYLFHTSARLEPQAAYPHIPIIDKPTQRDVLVALIKTLTNKTKKNG